MNTITPEPPNLSPLAMAGAVLIKGDEYLSAVMAEVRETQKPVSASFVNSSVSWEASNVSALRGPDHRKESANVWRAARWADRAAAAQEIIDAALAAGQPEGSA